MLFRGLDFKLNAGQAGLVKGPNGVGKSSLLRLAAGLLKPYAGSLQAPEDKALCDDRLALDEHLPLARSLAFWARLDGKSPAEAQAAMEAADIAHLGEVPVRYFSTGQRQRARLARTYLTGARLWLLDEPGNGLDSAALDQLGIAIRRHLDDGGIILAASHIPLPVSFDLTLELQPLKELESSS